MIDATLAKMAAFPDIAILAEDVIWSEDATGHALSSHRSIISGTHTGFGAYGAPTGRRYEARCIADCAVRDEVIDDEWLVYDTGAIARQLGLDPCEYARTAPIRPLHRPPRTGPAPTAARGNDNEWGQRLADILTRIMDKDIAVIRAEYDRAVRVEHPGGRGGWSWDFADFRWMQLRAAFPSATFALHHVIGRSDPRSRTAPRFAGASTASMTALAHSAPDRRARARHGHHPCRVRAPGACAASSPSLTKSRSGNRSTCIRETSDDNLELTG